MSSRRTLDPRPRFCTDGERKVAKRLIKNLLDKGCEITVFLEGMTEPTVVRSRNRQEIYGEMSETGAEGINVHKDGKVAGWFYVLYGNAEDGSELIADYTANPFSEQVYNEVYPDG